MEMINVSGYVAQEKLAIAEVRPGPPPGATEGAAPTQCLPPNQRGAGTPQWPCPERRWRQGPITESEGGAHCEPCEAQL